MDSDAWNQRYRGKDLLWAAEPNRFVAAELAALAPGRALDLACGEGRNAVWLAGRGWRLTAVDFSEVAIEKARELATSQDVVVDWVVADLREYQPEAGGYDLVLLSYLQVPEADRSLIWARAVAAVALGGTFFLVAHDLLNLSEGHGGPQDAAVLYTPDDVVAVLDGFEIVKAERVRRPVNLETGETAEAVDVLVRAVRAVPTGRRAPGGEIS